MFVAFVGTRMFQQLVNDVVREKSDAAREKSGAAREQIAETREKIDASGFAGCNRWTAANLNESHPTNASNR